LNRPASPRLLTPRLDGRDREIVHPGYSGASLERPGIDRIRDQVAARGISVVVAQDRDRFAREPAYHCPLRREFEERNCKLKALNDRGDGSPEGELTDGILDQLVSRRSCDETAARGTVTCGRSTLGAAVRRARTVERKPTS
jgi:hypothetical protein